MRRVRASKRARVPAHAHARPLPRTSSSVSWPLLLKPGDCCVQAAARCAERGGRLLWRQADARQPRTEGQQQQLPGEQRSWLTELDGVPLCLLDCWTVCPSAAGSLAAAATGWGGGRRLHVLLRRARARCAVAVWAASRPAVTMALRLLVKPRSACRSAAMRKPAASTRRTCTCTGHARLQLHARRQHGNTPATRRAPQNAPQAFDSPGYPHLASLGVDVEWNERYLLKVEGSYRPRCVRTAIDVG